MEGNKQKVAGSRSARLKRPLARLSLMASSSSDEASASDGESDVGSDNEAWAKSEDESVRDSEYISLTSVCDSSEGEELACSEDESDKGSEQDSDEDLGDSSSSSSKDTSFSEGTSSASDGESSGVEIETWAEHVQRFGEAHRCCRCRYRRNRADWHAALTYKTKDEERVSWLEERCEVGHRWGLGCKLCRWFGAKNRWGNAEVRGERATRFNQLAKHAASNHTHQRAQAAYLQEVDPQVEANPQDRHDVPTFAMMFTAYNGAKKGASFSSYEDDLKNSRACGAPIPHCRKSREIAKRIVKCAADELFDQDRKLLRKCTDIALTMDARRSKLIVRMRLTMGNGLPEGLHPEAEDDDVGGASPSAGGGAPHRSMAVASLFGKYIYVADRLLSFRKSGTYDNSEDMANHLVDSLRELCGDDELWKEVQAKVNVFTPDGAHDEQIVGKLAAETFPKMMAVLRCAAHAVVGAMKAGWEANPLAKKLTRCIVQEVAKYIRSSERFAGHVSSKSLTEAVAALENFSFAPQRFASKERPLTRFVVFAKAIMESLALEVCIPTDRKRKAWAENILKELDGVAWTLIGMLADLSEDCTRFVRKLDERHLDPIEAAIALRDFDRMLREEYVRGDMWMRRESTYTARIQQMLEETRVAQYGNNFSVIRKPTKTEFERCQAEVANVARGIKAYLKAQFPSCSLQVLFGCFHLGGGESPGGGGSPKKDDLAQLLYLLRWDQSDQDACVREYIDAWPRAVRRKKAGEQRDRDVWAREVVDREGGPLKRIVTLALGFLVSETEAERSFSIDRWQSSKRPKLAPDTRTSGLKVRGEDGVVLGGGNSSSSR